MVVGPDYVFCAKLRCVCADASSAPGVAVTLHCSPSIVPEAPVFTGVDLTAEDVAPPGIGDALVPAAIAHAGDTCVSLPGALAEQTEQVRFRLPQLRPMCFCTALTSVALCVRVSAAVSLCGQAHLKDLPATKLSLVISQ